MKDKDAIIAGYEADRAKYQETINKAETLAKSASEADQLREELVKLRDINKSQAEALETAKQALETQKASSATALKEVQDLLNQRLDESSAIDRDVLTPAGFGDGLTTDNRLERILELGELIAKLQAVGKDFNEKFFPADPVPALANLPAQIETATTTLDERLRSKVRGGAKTALGLLMSHYPEVELWRIAAGFPEETADGCPMDKAARREIMRSVSGYASKIAKMVSLTTTFKEVECPPTPGDTVDEGEEAAKEPEAAVVAAPAETSEPAADPEPAIL